jgi:hypothetical protein
VAALRFADLVALADPSTALRTWVFDANGEITQVV